MTPPWSIMGYNWFNDGIITIPFPIYYRHSLSMRITQDQQLLQRSDGWQTLYGSLDVCMYVCIPAYTRYQTYMLDSSHQLLGVGACCNPCK
jgi:hypothetical protein